jgi:hypothetical protein
MNVCMALYSESYQDLARITLFKNRVEYCHRWGYLPMFRKVPDPKNQKEAWDIFGYGGPMAVLRAFNENKAIDWLWLAGTDGMVTNMLKPLPLPKLSNIGLVLSTDCHGINGGSILLKNHPWVRDYLRWILSNRDRWNHEQEAFQESYAENAAFVETADQRVMNSYDYRLYAEALKRPAEAPRPGFEDLVQAGQWKPGDFFIHWPGLGLEERLKLAAHYETEVVR